MFIHSNQGQLSIEMGWGIRWMFICKLGATAGGTGSSSGGVFAVNSYVQCRGQFSGWTQVYIGKRGLRNIGDIMRLPKYNKSYDILFYCPRAGDSNEYKKVHGRHKGGRLDAKSEDDGVGRADTVVALVGVLMARRWIDLRPILNNGSD